jgi:hypothetical protein
MKFNEIQYLKALLNTKSSSSRENDKKTQVTKLPCCAAKKLLIVGQVTLNHLNVNRAAMWHNGFFTPTC